MRQIHRLYFCCLALLAATSCSTPKESTAGSSAPPPVSYFKVDAATAGTLSGVIRFHGPRPARKPVDMSSDPACVQAHGGKASDESLVVGANGALANVFVYVKTGLEGKTFAPPAAPATIDQKGCWFRPRVLGIQVGETLQVINSDPVTHNIHPLARVNREWNHSQGEGEAPLARKFLHPEIMIPVKCNIHSWMHSFIGVTENPYFAVSSSDGTFHIDNLPPGDYTVEAWHETLGVQDQTITVAPSGKITLDFDFKAVPAPKQ